MLSNLSSPERGPGQATGPGPGPFSSQARSRDRVRDRDRLSQITGCFCPAQEDDQERPRVQDDGYFSRQTRQGKLGQEHSQGQGPGQARPPVAKQPVWVTNKNRHRDRHRHGQATGC